ALSRDALRATMIPDGKHIPPHVFRAMSHALGDRLMLTTDAMAGASVGPGLYSLCHMDIEVGEDRIARIPGQQHLAGSTLTQFKGAFRAAEMSGLPWPEMWDAFSVRPAEWVGFAHGLEQGYAASFCLMELAPELKLTGVYHQGLQAA